VLIRDGEEVARFGRLHPRIAGLYKFRQPVFVGEIEFGELLSIEADQVRYSSLPRLPSASRDVSALIPNTVLWGDIEKAVEGLGIPELASVRIFDVYSSKEMSGEFRSLAFRVTYRSATRTLTDEEVLENHEKVRQLLIERFGAQLR
jgi:phenylalanyl-tRNA synthetase beta chain